MAPLTAVNFTLLAAALLLIDVETPDGRRPGNWLALAIAANSYLAFLGYMYGVDALYQVAALSSVTVHTAVLFVLVSLGLALARPGSPLVRQITEVGPAGLVNRRLDEVYDAPLCALIEPQLEAAFKGTTVNFEFASPKSGRAFRR